MFRIIVVIILVLSVLALSAPSVAMAGYKCQIDKFDLWFTGKSKTVSGKLLFEYKCASNHYYWIVQN